NRRYEKYICGFVFYTHKFENAMVIYENSTVNLKNGEVNYKYESVNYENNTVNYKYNTVNLVNRRVNYKHNTINLENSIEEIEISRCPRPGPLANRIMAHLPPLVVNQTGL